MKVYVLIPAIFILFILGGCALKPKVLNGDGMEKTFTYKQISQDEAKKMMEADDGHVILDVRREDEYAAGHIPGAILVPNESIGTEQPEELPDLNQVILVYCRSGNRSKQASQKLADMGYVNVYEFGGIIDWTGEIVTEEDRTDQEDAKTQEDQKNQEGGDGSMHENTKEAAQGTAELSFQSFDGGGPEFQVVLKNQDIVSYESSVHYAKADHAELTGAGYTITYIFTGKKAGETSMTIEERSPIADNLDHKYHVSVDEDLHVTIREVSVRDIFEDMGETDMCLLIGDDPIPVLWEENESVEALKELCPLTISMSMYGGFEQVGAIGQDIPREDVQTEADYGDIMLYSGNQIVIFYGSNSWAYTKLGHIDLTREELEELLGNGDVTITIE